MDEEPSNSRRNKETPVKAVKRDVKGLLSLQLESPSQSDVGWSSVDSPFKSRAVGGKSKFLKSSNQLTPKNNVTRKKYYSSPILVARSSDDGNKVNVSDDRDSENRRILEEFQRQFNNENYVPRNLLDNLSEGLEDSIIIPDAEINTNKYVQKSNENHRVVDDSVDQVDLDILDEIEKEEKRLLDEKSKTQNLNNNNKKKNNSKATNPVTKETQNLSQLPTVIGPPLSSSTQMKAPVNKYFDSDDDDDFILSIPLEKLTDKRTNGNPFNNDKKEPPKKNKLDALIPVKRQHVVQNQNNVNINPPATYQSNIGSSGTDIQEPLAKKLCTAEEIAEKRRQAMQRREAFLRNLRATQKSK